MARKRIAVTRTGRSTVLLAPALVLVVTLLLITAFALVTQSLGLQSVVGEPGLSLAAYSQVIGSGFLGWGTTITVGIAIVSTSLSVLIGFAAALAIRAGALGGRVSAASAAITIPIPHVVAASTIGLLVADAGFIPRILPGLEWPQFVAGPWWLGVIYEYVWKESAFVALVVVATTGHRAREYTETAAGLGAGAWQRLRWVTLPHATPALIATGAIVFIYTLGSFEVPRILGRTYPEPLSVLAYRLFTSSTLTDRPQAMALATMVVALSVVVAAVAVLGLRRKGAFR